MVMAPEQQPYNLKEVSFKAACPSSGLWAPRTFQRTRQLKSPVLGLLPPGLPCHQPVGALKMIRRAAAPPSQNFPGCRDPRCQTFLGPMLPAVRA